LIRAVVDTSIWVRAVIKPTGSVGPVLRRLEAGGYSVLYSGVLLDELVDVLSRPRIRDRYHVTPRDVYVLPRALGLRGEAVRPDRVITACRDPKDDKFLEAAIAGGGDAIVTGDEDLLVLDPFEGIPIVTPVRFLTMLDAVSGSSVP
jgi:putative PIN family toxin of toxin-antitoxin system